MSRCMYCDYCPTAPSLSLLSDKGGIKLQWDRDVNGYHCGGRCKDYDIEPLHSEDVDDVYLKEELVEVIEVKTPMPST